MNRYIKFLIIFVTILVSLGIVLVFTASGTYSLMKFNNIYYLFKQHLWKVFFAALLMVFCSYFPYDLYRKYSKPMIFIWIAVLVLTFFLAPKVKGAARWIPIGSFQFQPSEVAKVILIIHLSMMIEKMGEGIKDFKNGLIFPLMWIFAIAFLVLIQPNVSTAMIIVFTSFTILFVAGAKFRHLAGIFAVSLVVVAIAVLFFFGHAQKRMVTFFNSASGNITEINIQVKQAKIALGSGGLVGVGFGHSRQSDLFLPESYGDFIFSILGEETGFVGTVSILSLYLLLFGTCLVIAKKAQDTFGQMLVLGLGFNVIISAFINAGVVTGILPTTGITLPFISFGGTSIMIFGASMGMIINVGRLTAKTTKLKFAQV
jgi:cell division protein FtsW